MSKAIILYSYSNTMNCILISGALILLHVMFYIQLPFPMDSLYADPDRKVIIYATLICPISERISYSADCNQLETSMVGLWCFGLILWMGSNILPSSYCKLFLCLLLYLLKRIYGVCLHLCEILIYDRQRCCQDLVLCGKLQKIIRLKPLRMIEVVCCNRFDLFSAVFGEVALERQTSWSWI